VIDRTRIIKLTTQVATIIRWYEALDLAYWVRTRPLKDESEKKLNS